MDSLLGALVGDAAGAVLEGYGGGRFSEEVVEKALTMPGGGRLRVGPGQITDDGELSLALHEALLLVDSLKQDDPVPHIAEAYAIWYDSFPFDIGQTCSLAFEALWELWKKSAENGMYKRLQGITRQLPGLLEMIEELNGGSEANGALMRITGMMPWVVRHMDYPMKRILDLAEQDAALSHPNQVCIDTNKIYIYALYLLHKDGVSHEAILKELDAFVEGAEILSQKVKNWYFKESHNISAYDCTVHIGHVKHAFILAMYFLRNPMISYRDALRITLEKGGDTDTNAAIVGGLVGSYRSIPVEMRRAVIGFRADGHIGHTRPEGLWPASYFSLEEFGS
jgi:ADP-ribosyl-[dinitrogen reductase] hydrolase